MSSPKGDADVGSDGGGRKIRALDDKDSSVIESEEPINDVVDADICDQIGEEQLQGQDK